MDVRRAVQIFFDDSVTLNRIYKDTHYVPLLNGVLLSLISAVGARERWGVWP